MFWQEQTSVFSDVAVKCDSGGMNLTDLILEQVRGMHATAVSPVFGAFLWDAVLAEEDLPNGVAAVVVSNSGAAAAA